MNTEKLFSDSERLLIGLRRMFHTCKRWFVLNEPILLSPQILIIKFIKYLSYMSDLDYIYYSKKKDIHDFIINNNFKKNCSSPSFSELYKIATNRKDDIFLFALKANSNIVACAIFYISDRLLHNFQYRCLSLYGHTFFDYNTFYFEEAYKKSFLSFIFESSSKIGFDILVLDNILSTMPSKFILSYDSKVFNKDMVSKGFSHITSKKSLRHARNRCKKKFDYIVEHHIGNYIKDEHINILSRLHKLKWKSENIDSAFNDENRKHFYSSYKENKIFSMIKINNDILAVHYGILYNDTLLFHTPVINKKFLKYSPMQVLISETARYCDENNFKIFDLGLGHESYKDRFSNSNRQIYSYYYCLNFISKIKLFISFNTAKFFKLFR